MWWAKCRDFLREEGGTKAQYENLGIILNLGVLQTIAETEKSAENF